MATLVSMWIGGKMPERLRANVEHNVEVLREGDRFLFVCDDDPKIAGVDVVAWGDVVDEISDSPWRDRASAYVAKFEPGNRYGEEHALSDLCRLYLATSMPDMVWLDTDCRLLAWPETPMPGPYFAQVSEVPRYVDQCFFVVNGATEYFQRLLSLLCDSKRVYRRTLFCLIGRRLAGEHNLISPKCFTHAGSIRPWVR